MGVASLVTGLKNEQMEQIDFLHAGTNSGRLNVDAMIYMWAWSKIAMAF